MQENRESSNDGIGSVVVTSLLLVGLTLGAAAVAHQTEAARLVPGDIIVFSADSAEPATVSADIPALMAAGGRTRSASGCTLHTGAMRASGGSLIVEAKEPENAAAYKVHWASAGGTGSGCGAVADLFLSREALFDLATAAGGIGVTHDRRSLAAAPVSVDGMRQAPLSALP